MYCILIDAHLSDGDRLASLDVFPLMEIDQFKVSTRVCVSTHSMYCILIDAHLSDGDRLATLDVFSLMGNDPFKVSKRLCVTTHSLIMYVLHSYRCPPL